MSVEGEQAGESIRLLKTYLENDANSTYGRGSLLELINE